MSFLPIVERELRVASRNRSTLWVRVVAALVALVIGGGYFLLTTVAKFAFGTSSLGGLLFGVLTWLSLAAALSAGLFFTSDCLSEEKREGTLGFLFLTDLRGYDVVLGKLLATSLQGFYALLAVLPILAVTLLMGGVTGAQFGKTSLALVNALLISLGAGLCASALSRDAQKALAATLALLLVLVAAGPAMDAVIAVIGRQSFRPLLSLSSPGYLFVTAGASGQAHFWPGLLVNQAVGWGLLGLTAFLVPRTWQTRARKVAVAGTGWSRWWRFGGARRRAALRRRLVGVNPVLWLACRERWQAVTIWAVTILLAGGSAASLAASERGMLLFLWKFFAQALTLVLYLAIAAQAGRFFVEAKRTGLMELLLATPLTAPQIVQGQWRAMMRMFGVPVVLFLAAHLLGTFLVQQRTWGSVAASVTSTSGAGAGASSVGTGFTPPPDVALLAGSAAQTLTVATALAALTWFGMWMGLNSRNTGLCTLKTILFVQVIPWFAISFASGLMVPLLWASALIGPVPAVSPRLMVWWPLLSGFVGTLLYLVKDVAFCLWSRRKLDAEFRNRAWGAGARIQLVQTASLPRAAVSPPLLPLN